MNCYLFSGLGAKCSILKHIELPENINPIFVEWMNPKKDEEFIEYIKRFINKIDVSKPFCLLGFSLGGIVVQEISKIVKAKKVIIISSVRTIKELPFQIRMLRYIPWVIKPISQIFKYHEILYKITHGAPADKLKNVLQNDFIKDSEKLVNWCINALSTWDNEVDTQAIQIIGNKDITFPLRYIKNPSYIIDKGNHFMCVTHSDEINRILEKELGTLK